MVPDGTPRVNRDTFHQANLGLSRMQSAERGYLLDGTPALQAAYQQAHQQVAGALAAVGS